MMKVKQDLKSDFPLQDLCPYELNLFDRLALQKHWMLVYHQVATYNWRFRAMLTAFMQHYCKSNPGNFGMLCVCSLSFEIYLIALSLSL
jgi:hypothetical protein